MQIDNSTAIVDNDFINHLVGSRLADDLLVRALLDIFNSLSFELYGLHACSSFNLTRSNSFFIQLICFIFFYKHFYICANS